MAHGIPPRTGFYKWQVSCRVQRPGCASVRDHPSQCCGPSVDSLRGGQGDISTHAPSIACPDTGGTHDVFTLCLQVELSQAQPWQIGLA